MTLARLLAAALAVCSLPALAQDQQSQNTQTSTLLCTMRSGAGCIHHDQLLVEMFFGSNSASTATPSGPWILFPKPSANLDPGLNVVDPTRLDQYRFDQTKDSPHARLIRPDTLDTDTTCYAIRGYVVARDSKDSDSTHPAGYSTCQPSNRFQVKSADLRVISGDR